MASLKTMRGIGRLLYFAGYTSLRITQIIGLNLIKGVNMERSMRIRKSWARHLLPAIGVRLKVTGNAPDFPCILMCNHRSYLDPALLIHDVIACPVSKAEVAKWPIIGYGAKMTGILFLQRESNTSRKHTLMAIGDKVRSGEAVMLFPEGTTHVHPKCQVFKPGGFKLAAQEGIPIVPVAIDYQSISDYWVGDDTFLPHFVKRFSENEMQVALHYGPTLISADAEVLRQDAVNWINQELQLIQKSFT